MTDSEILTLHLYVHSIWPNQFPIPSDPDLQAARVAVWQDIVGDLNAADLHRAIKKTADLPFPHPIGRWANMVTGRPNSDDPEHVWNEWRLAELEKQHDADHPNRYLAAGGGQPRRMRPNDRVATRNGPHAIEHDYDVACDVTPACEPVLQS